MLKDFQEEIKAVLYGEYGITEYNAGILVRFSTGIYQEEIDILEETCVFMPELVEQAAFKLAKFQREFGG